MRVVSLYAVVGCISLTAIQLGYTEPSASIPVAAATAPTAQTAATWAPPEKISGVPMRLVISRLEIDLPVLPGLYTPETDTWSLTDSYVHHANISARPNNLSGSTFLYGHNAWSVLGKTFNIQAGDRAEIITENGTVFRYIYINYTSATPQNAEVVTAPSDVPRLVLMTCEGVWNEGRRLMYFDFEEVVQP